MAQEGAGGCDDDNVPLHCWICSEKNLSRGRLVRKRDNGTKRRHTCALRASVVTSHGSGQTRSDLIDGSSVLIDMSNEIILNKFERGSLF